MVSRVLGAVGRLLIAAGVLILGFVAFQLWGTGLEQARQQDNLTDQYSKQLADEGIPASGDAESVAKVLGDDPTPAVAAPAPAQGDPVGVIEIPKIDLARVIVQGTSRPDLKKGPGHYVGTPMPGQPGNVGIAGHRTTYGAPFNRIDELVPDDEVILSTAQGRFVYKVIPAPGAGSQAWFTVAPTQTDVLNDVGDNRVTLTACHPKYSAKQRIIVQAVLQDRAAAASAPPASDAVKTVSANNGRALDEGLGSTPDELPIALGFGAAAAAVLLGAGLVARRTPKPWLVYLIASPLVLALVWFGYVHMDRYLPAI